MSDDVDLPRLGALGWARWAWRQLTSMRTALFLLLMLAVAAVPGSMVPQNGVDPNQVARFIEEHPAASPWLDGFGFFDVYTSVWFSAIYLLLFISLIGCVIPRTRQHASAMRSRPPRTPARLDRLPAYQRAAATDAVAAEQVLAVAEQQLRRRRYRVDRHAESVSAERGYLRETGNLVFHVALLGLLCAVAAGSLLSYRGQAIVITGEGFANVISQYDSPPTMGALVSESDLQPFRLTLDDLTVRFETEARGNQFAAPRDFSAALTVVEHPGAAPRTETLKVNQPLNIDGASVYLQGNGYAPVVTVRDADGVVVKSGPVVFLAQDTFYTSTGVVKVLETSPQIGLQGVFLPTAASSGGEPVSVFPDQLNPRWMFTVWQGDLGLDSGRPQSVYQLDTTGMTQVRDGTGRPLTVVLAPGESATLPDGLGSVTFERVDRFAALQVRTDPAKGWALAFAVLAIAGLALSLFVARRRVWVRVLPDGGVEVAALARSDDPRLDRELADIVSALPVAVPEAVAQSEPQAEPTRVSAVTD